MEFAPYWPPDLICIYGTERLNMLLSSKSILAGSKHGRYSCRLPMPSFAAVSVNGQVWHIELREMASNGL